MQVNELPRDENGAVLGTWRLRHRQPDFSDPLGGIDFRAGVSMHPVSGRQLERVLGAMGDEIDAEPWDEQRDESTPAERRDEPAHEPAHTEVPTQESAGEVFCTPTNADELRALGEPALRAVAAELGASDRRWGVAKLRRFIADELGIEIGDE